MASAYSTVLSDEAAEGGILLHARASPLVSDVVRVVVAAHLCCVTAKTAHFFHFSEHLVNANVV